MSEARDAEEQARDITLDTYRYLRAGMAIMVGLLAAGVVGERLHATCWQESISAYYYTTAHSVFVAALCAIGVQLIVYRGSSDTEDALLDLAGVLAFIVAFVPTGSPGQVCGAAGPWAKWEPAITNNVWALIIALLLAYIASRWMYRRTHTDQHRSVLGEIAVWLLRVVLALGLIAFVFRRDLFNARAHGVAAGTLFAAIIVTVCLTAFVARRQSPTPEAPHPRIYYRLYQVIAVLMLATLLIVIGVHLLLTPWSHAILVVESLLILEFAAYWVAQTIELWKTPNRAALLPGNLRTQLAHKREERGPTGLAKDMQELKRHPAGERLMRAL